MIPEGKRLLIHQQGNTQLFLLSKSRSFKTLTIKAKVNLLQQNRIIFWVVFWSRLRFWRENMKGKLSMEKWMDLESFLMRVISWFIKESSRRIPLMDKELFTIQINRISNGLYTKESFWITRNMELEKWLFQPMIFTLGNSTMTLLVDLELTIEMEWLKSGYGKERLWLKVFTNNYKDFIFIIIYIIYI